MAPHILPAKSNKGSDQSVGKTGESRDGNPPTPSQAIMDFGRHPAVHMASRFRNFLESIAYAGMKPGKPKAQSKRMRLLGPLRGPVERLISGGGRQDPLYLSKRTFGQRFLGWVKVGVPLFVVVVVVVFGFRRYRRVDKPPEVLSPAEVAAKMLPELNKPIRSEEH